MIVKETAGEVVKMRRKDGDVDLVVAIGVLEDMSADACKFRTKEDFQVSALLDGDETLHVGRVEDPPAFASAHLTVKDEASCTSR